MIPAMAFSIATAMFSCNGGGDEKKDDKKPADSTAVAAFTPFKVMRVKHKVADFAKWLAGFNAHDSMRTAAGLYKTFVGRGDEDSNLVIVFSRVNDLQKAKDFGASPNLKDAMQKSGVVGVPEISYAEVLRFDSTTDGMKDRLTVGHKVKDYAAWLKVFDQEGSATRATFGMKDRAIARDMNDSNMVYVTFAVTDKAKAKARGESPELKKLMTDAGVVGPPAMFMYKAQ